MELSGIFSNQRYKTVVIVAGALTLIYVLLNLFVIGGDGFIYRLNSSLTVLLAILNALFAFSLWGLVNTGRNNRLLWGGLLAGWALWMVAEFLWVVYGYLYPEVPYPSPADFFWLIGYIPMGYALYSRSREIPTKMSRTQKMSLWTVSLTTILITVAFILIPIIQSNDTANWLESALNVMYPLFDLFLLIIVMRLIFIYVGGDYGFSWSLLTAGFILQPISDLAFSYASLSGLYYPDLKVNFISSMVVDVPYTLSYLVWILGIYALRLTLSRHKPFERIVQPQLIPNTSILIFLKSDDTVIETSNNFDLVFGDVRKKGSSLTELIGIHQQDARSILDKIQSERKITDHPISLDNRLGVFQEAYLSGIATISQDGKYSGCNLVLRILVEDDYTLDEKLSWEQKAAISHVRIISGSSERDRIRKLILDYHLAYLKQLYNLAFHTGGAQLSLAFLEHLQQIDGKHQWQLEFHPETLLKNSDYQLSLLREALPVLLEEAKRFVSQLTDSNTVEAEIKSLSSQFDEAVHKNVAYYS